MFHQSLSANIFLLRVVGAWPREYLNKPANFAYLAFIVCFFLVPISCFPLIHIYLSENKDLIKISQTAFMSCELLLIPMKLIALLLDYEKLRTAVCYWDTAMFYSAPSHKTQKLIAIMSKQTTRMCKCYTWLCALGAITWATKPMQNLSKKTLPADLWLPFDPFKNDFRYVLTYLHSSVGKMHVNLDLSVLRLYPRNYLQLS